MNSCDDVALRMRRLGWISCDDCFPVSDDADCEEYVWLASDEIVMGLVHYKSVKAKNGYATATLFWKPTTLTRPKHPLD